MSINAPRYSNSGIADTSLRRVTASIVASNAASSGVHRDGGSDDDNDAAAAEADDLTWASALPFPCPFPFPFPFVFPFESVFALAASASSASYACRMRAANCSMNSKASTLAGCRMRSAMSLNTSASALPSCDSAHFRYCAVRAVSWRAHASRFSFTCSVDLAPSRCTARMPSASAGTETNSAGPHASHISRGAEANASDAYARCSEAAEAEAESGSAEARCVADSSETDDTAAFGFCADAETPALPRR